MKRFISKRNSYDECYWLEVDAEPVIIPGFESLDLFVHRELDGSDEPVSGLYRVSDGVTGACLCNSEFSAADAVAAATYHLAWAGMDGFRRVQGRLMRQLRLEDDWTRAERETLELSIA